MAGSHSSLPPGRRDSASNLRDTAQHYVRLRRCLGISPMPPNNRQAKLEPALYMAAQSKSISISWRSQWHLNQITAETGLNGRGRHAHEPRTSKERGRRRLHCAKPSAMQLKLRRMTNKLAETLEIGGNTIADQRFPALLHSPRLPGDFYISQQFLIRGYAAWILPTAILPVRRSS